MKKMVKLVFSILGIIFVIYFLNVMVSSFFIGGKVFFPINYERAEKRFQQDKERMLVVSEYFSISEYKKIYIPTSIESDMMSVDGKNIKIEDIEVIQSIKNLKRKGYSVIGKENNTVYFQIWSNLDAGRGIAFSIDGAKPTLQFLTKLEKLHENNWYYYEEDYRTWQNNNTTNGFPNYLLGEWDLQYAKTRGAGEASKEYPLDKLYSEETLDNGVKIIFNSDGTFIRIVGNPLAESTTTEGTYILRYENKILLKHEDGTQSTVRYSVETGEIVYYTVDDHLNAIDEYYKRQEPFVSHLTIWGRTFFGIIIV